MNEPFNPELENDKIISTGNPAFNEQNSSDENIEVLETLESAPSEKKSKQKKQKTEKKSKHKISVKTITRSMQSFFLFFWRFHLQRFRFSWFIRLQKTTPKLTQIFLRQLQNGQPTV